MNSLWVAILSISVLLLLVLVVLEALNLKKPPALYIDQGKIDDQVFRSAKYNITAKPDIILNNKTIVEKKSRTRGLYDSDITQMMATALAVRSKYKITNGLLDTGDQRHTVNLNYSDAKLFSKIKYEYQQAVLISKGLKPDAKPSRGKCRSCQFKTQCEFSAAAS